MNAALPPWLLDPEVADLCKPLTQAAAQIRYMQNELGLNVRRKPNGDPLVMRAEFEALSASTAKPTGKRGPSRDALVATFARQA